MAYESLKLFHLCLAAVLLTSMVYCLYFWLQTTHKELASQLLQRHTLRIIMPAALLQLLTGFTMISLKHYSLASLWIQGSVWGFVLVVASWVGFIWSTGKVGLSRGRGAFLCWSTVLCSICILSLLTMIFLMTNRIH